MKVRRTTLIAASDEIRGICRRNEICEIIVIIQLMLKCLQLFHKLFFDFNQLNRTTFITFTEFDFILKTEQHLLCFSCSKNF